MERTSDQPECGADALYETRPFGEAILKTLAYADVFDYPLAAGEVWQFLTVPAESPEAVQRALAYLVRAGLVANGSNHYHLPGRDHIVPLRLRRERESAPLWENARRYTRILARLPFVRMVAITGSLAASNCDSAADIDVLLVVQPGRLWIPVWLILGLRRLGVLATPKLCPNYVLSARALAISERDLYVAHELARMVPLYGREVHDEMMRANGWTAEYLPNADRDPGHPQPERLGRLGCSLKRLLERVLSGRLGRWLDQRARQWLVSHLRPAVERSKGPCVFTGEEFRTHYEGHESRIRREYETRLRAHGLQ